MAFRVRLSHRAASGCRSPPGVALIAGGRAVVLPTAADLQKTNHDVGGFLLSQQRGVRHGPPARAGAVPAACKRDAQASQQH